MVNSTLYYYNKPEEKTRRGGKGEKNKNKEETNEKENCMRKSEDEAPA